MREWKWPKTPEQIIIRDEAVARTPFEAAVERAMVTADRRQLSALLRGDDVRTRGDLADWKTCDFTLNKERSQCK